MKISNGLFILFVLLLATIALGTIAQAQLLVEDFSYAPGDTLHSQAGWSAHSGAGTNPPLITTGGLSYTGYSGSGIGNAVSFTTTGEDNNKVFASYPGGIASGSLYYSMMVKLDSTATTGDYFFHILKNSSTFSARIFAKRAANGNIRFGIGRSSTAANINYSDSIYSVGTTYLLVAKYTVIPGATNDTVALWINPAIGPTEPAPTVFESNTDRTTTDIDTVYGVAIRQGTAANAPIGTVDGIRVDTGWPLNVSGPLTGTKTIPGNYPTIAAAISALNTLGVGPGGVTFNVAAGYTETITATLSLTATGAAGSPIVFQKSGAGANPLVTAYATGTGTPSTAVQDGIWQLVGSDYVTINGIDLTDPNVANPATMEYGYALYRASATDGCQNVTIKNCTITLNRVNNDLGSGPAVDGSRGIDVVNATPTSATTALTITDAAGANSNNKFYSNAIQNCNIGIALIGFADVTPFTYVDQNNDVGGASVATGNTIKNYGGGGVVNPAAAVRTLAQYGINVSYNTIDNNDGGGVNHGTTLRGIYLNTAVSASATVTYNTLSLKSGGTTTQVSIIENVSGATAASNTINISNNTIQNCTNDLTTTGIWYGIWNNAASASTLTISNNKFTGNSSKATSGATYLIYNSGAVASTININNDSLSYSFTNTAAYTGTMYNIYNGGGTTLTSLSISNNNFSNYTYATVTGTGSLYFVYNTASCANTTISNNTWTNLSLNHSGSEYLMYNSTSTQVALNVNNNTIVTEYTRTAAAGAMYCYYSGASSLGTSTQTFSGNNFSNITAATAGTGTFYGFYNSDGASSPYPKKSIFNNTISNVTYNTTGAFYGFYTSYLGDGSTTSGSAVYNNTLSGVTTSGTMYCLYPGSTVSLTYKPEVYGNTVNNITTNGAASILYGSYIFGGGAGLNFYKNKIYTLTANGATGVAYGMYVGGATATSIYNNLVGDIKAPNSSPAAAPYLAATGLYISGGTTVNAYYNTINLNTTSTGTNFTSAAAYVTTTPTTVNLQDNIFNNLSVPKGAGFTLAYGRNGTALTNYASTSNNNLFYAGTPSATNLIFYDGTNSDQTLAAFKARVTPREASSITENPTFRSTIGGDATFLHIDSTVATQIESGGTPIAGIADDYDGQTRNATAPDIGADEFTGIAIDLTPPNTVYTPLGSTSSTSARTLTATITDLSGVPTSGLGLPVLYWKRNSGSYTAATATSLGSHQYQFSFGTGVSLGDTVSYYIAAQDSVTPPNVGVQPSLGASGFTADPPAASTPPTIPSAYFITNVPLSGNYTVGLTRFNQVAGRNITFEKSVRKVMKEVFVEVPAHTPAAKGAPEEVASTSAGARAPGATRLVEVEEVTWIPMEDGRVYEGNLYVKKNENPNLQWPADIDGVYPTITAAVADLNLRGTSGFTNFLFVDTSFATETYPIVVNVTNVAKPTATTAVTFKPNTGVTATISGAAAGTQIFRILTSYVNFDGSNSGGTTRNLTIANTSTTTPQVMVIGSLGTIPITNCTVKNCNIINGINSSSALIVSDGTTPGTAGWFNNITIQNNTIQNAYIANYNIAVASAGNGTGLTITGNDLTTAGANAVRLVGVYVQGIDGATVSNNNIGNFTTLDASNITGIWFATGTINSTVSNNTIGPISSTTGPPRGIAVSSAVANANVQLVGNIVSGLATSYSSAPYGIYVFSTTTGVTVARNKVSSIYNTNTGGYGARAIHVNTGLAASNITVKNNFVWDVKATSDVSSTYWGIGIGVEGATGGVGVYYNSVNLFGSMVGYTTGTLSTAFGVLTSTATSLDVRDNIFVNTFDNTNSATDKAYAINSQAPNTAFTNINNNDYYVGGPAGVLGYLGADQTTLAAWQTATGRDSNSVSGTPFFRDSTDLHIDSTQVPLVVSNAGTPIAGITNDIDGQTRNVLTPDIGADEFALATVALSGTYTVGTGGQFATIPDAFTALQNYGVSGPVTLLLTNSQYDVSGSGTTRDNHVAPPRPRGMVDPLDPLYRGETRPVQTDNPDTVGALTLLGPITGASSTNRITIRPATGTATTITGNGGWVLSLLNASYVTVDGIGLTGATSLTINSTAPGSIGLLLEGNSDNNIIQNVTVRAPFGTSTAGTTTLYLYADSATATPDNNVVQNNVIASGTDGVVILGNATSFPNANSISNNMIGTPTDSIGETGVYVQQANNTLINGNKIQNVRQVFTNVAGIWVATKHLGTKIWDNVIHNVKISPTTTAAGFASGFYIFGTATDTTNGDYYNNMIYDLDYLGTFTGGTVRGMYVSTGRLDTIAYNSIYLTGTATTNVTSGALYTSTHIGQVFRNNIAINARTETGTGRGIAFYKASTTSTISSNYNDLYVPAQPLSYIAGVGTANDTTIAQWRARGYDSMSVSTMANFQAPYLHIDPTIPTPLDAGGIPVAGITTDFDGNARNATTPDIGADEFVVGVFPPPVITLVARSTRVPNAGDTLAVTCTITDTVGITAANLLYAVDSVAQTPIAMTRTSGTPQNGTYRGVLPGTANLNGKRIEYRIQAISSSGNSATTAITANNSYFAGVSPLSLTGVKAIASNGQNLYVNYYAKVTGIVNGPNFQAGNGNLSYYFQDAVGGMNLFMFGSAVPVLALGDSITVIGKILQFRGTTEITPDNATADITIAASGRTVAPIQLTLAQLNANPELYESRLVRLASLRRVNPTTPPWPAVGFNANIIMYQTVITDTTIMFLDLDTEIPGSPEPTYPVNVTGVAGQYTTSSTIYNNGYEIIPRYLTDFVSIVPTPGWSLQTSGITNQFYSVKAVNATTAWAAALGGRVLRTVDGGNTWTSVGGGRIGAFDIYNIAAVDANTAFVTTTPSTTTYIFRTTNGGAVWDTVFQQAGGFIDAIHMYDANNGIALGDPVPATLWVVLKTTNGGASWSRIATEPVAVGGEAGTQNDLAVSGPNNIWFGSSGGGRVYRSTNAGATWSSSIVPGGATATRVISVWFNGPNYGIAGHYTTSGVYNAARTTDGGVTWSAITVGTGTTYNIAVGGSGNDDFWMARGTDVFRSTNRGATWASSYTGTGTFYDVDFYTSGSSTYGWGVKDNGNIVAAFFTITGVKEDIAEIPQSFNLMQNYPNPFNPTTTLRYALPKDARVTLSIYNVLGQRIATLKDEVQNVGYYDVVWNGRNDFGSQIASGVYFYRIEAKPVDGGDAFTSIKKMLMLK